MLSQKLTNLPNLIKLNNSKYFSNLTKLNKLTTLRTEELVNQQKAIHKKETASAHNVNRRVYDKPAANVNTKEVERLLEAYHNLKNNKFVGSIVTSSPGVNLSANKESLLVSEDHAQNLDNESADGLLDSNTSDLDDALSSGNDRSVRRFKPLDLIALGPNLAIVLGIDQNSIYAMNFQGEIQALKPLNVRIHIQNPFKNPYWLPTKQFLEPIADFLKDPSKVEEFIPTCIQLVKLMESSSRSFSIKFHWKLNPTWDEYYNRKGLQQISLIELMKNVIKADPTPVELLGAYRYFREEKLHYYFNPDDFNILQFYSKTFVNRVTSIKQKLLDNSPDLIEFLGKAKLITNYSRAKFGKSYNLDLIGEGFKAYHPENNLFELDNQIENIKEDDLPKLNANDMEFVKLIQDFIMVDKFGLCHNLVPIVSSLLKPIGHYHYFYAPSAAEFLRDLGIYTPLENLNFLHPNLTLNNMDKNPNWGIDKFTENSEKVWDSIKDECAEIRKDFGELKVYTIDSESANEIDDGVSIEYDNPSNPNEAGGWLRVHIADPTVAINSLESPLLTQLLNQPSTAYLPNQILPMLPEWLSYGMCSLGDSENYKFRYVMTFSIRFNKSKKLNFNEIEVTPGKIRNLVKISYNEVDKLMGYSNTKDKQIIATYPINVNDKPEEISLTKNKNYDEKETLKDLAFIKNLVKSHRDERISNGALVTFFPKPYIQVEGQAQAHSDINNPSQNYPNFSQFSNSPTIRYELDKTSQNPNELTSNSIVAECMILAGKIASKFTETNKLPSLYVNQLAPNLDRLSLFEKTTYQNVLKNQSEALSPKDFMNFRSLTTPATTSLIPRGHNLMGIKSGYLRVTSPLRRFNDILNHIQFKNHLLKKPLLTKEELLKLNGLILDKNYRLNLLKKSTEKFFTLELLNGWNNLAQSNPESFENSSIVKFIGSIDKKSDYSNNTSVNNKKILVFEAQLIQFDLKLNSWQIYLTDMGIFSTLKLSEADTKLSVGDVKLVGLTQLVRDLNLVEFELV
ncbi:RNB-domain-containing protein [Conidiobolus coronatus NRRL 28638]|uniref:RNB-domain-containing protein n=1 Tax=Conidiobolus coronatus (strain ATCC 28846 / CBS 209.66 / NRRL 28638) TaxID=796925 RepID=A0A137P096_CONC2|nr:RNB-domain-containing protein [Conidiobolus coronatus NRRL 28638]|eukprot:KXN68294.1 RNB-domain-containing protein [Conidiobolus coronatus NRRL 28638]